MTEGKESMRVEEEASVENGAFAVCTTCPHGCRLAPGKTGYCRARVNVDGTIVPHSYGRVTSLALDPIEKKSIARWRPGTTVLSVGGYGCTMGCPFCQNDSIAQAGEDDVEWIPVEPEALVRRALELRDRGCIGIAYTYNEPLAAWEFVRDCARLTHEAGLANVLVSNGMVNAGPLAEVAPLMDAANIDLKCFTEQGYRRLGGDLSAVKRTIETLVGEGTCHVEVTTLVVPGLSDDPEQIDGLCAWLAGVDAGIPYHLTRFFPHYRMADVPPTPLSTMHELARVARRHLGDVLLGNM